MSFYIENIIADIKEQITSSNISVAEQYLASPYYIRRIKDYKSRSEIVIVGSGSYGLRLFEMFEAEGIKNAVCCFCDNSRERQELKIKNQAVLSVEEAVQRYPFAYYIITPRCYENELLQQLIDLKLEPAQISIFTFAYTGLVD